MTAAAGGRDDDESEDPVAVAVARDDVDGPPLGVAVGDEHGPSDALGVEDGDDVADVLGSSVRRDARWPAGPPVTGQDTVTAGKVRDQRLEHPRVADRCRPDEQQAGLAAP